jgi:hypothetical protein
MSGKKQHYVDNKLFLAAIKRYLPIVKPLRKEHIKLCKRLLKEGVPKKKLPYLKRPQNSDYEYIGECLVKIANHVAFKFNFINYTYREEMIGDAIENAILYLENFNPRLSKNPFSYFTQVMAYAFIRRIKKEKIQAYIKKKSIESYIDFFDNQGGDTGEYANTYNKFKKEFQNDTIVVDFEEKLKNKKQMGIKNRKKIDRPGIERFLVKV